MELNTQMETSYLLLGKLKILNNEPIFSFYQLEFKLFWLCQQLLNQI